MTPLTVSAVVTAHDRVAFLPLAVRSALDGGADEVVVVRNFSGPIEGCEGRYRDVRCDIADTNEKESRGVEAATGDLVAFLDDDDLWMPDKVSRVRAIFLAAPSLTYLCHAQRPIDAEGRPVEAMHPELASTHPDRFPRWDGRDFATLVRTIWPGNSSSTVVRRTWALTWLPSAREAGWSADLFWLVAGLLSGPPVRIESTPLTWLRLHDQNMSHARSTSPVDFRRRHRITCERFARSTGTLARIASDRQGPTSPMATYLRRSEAGFRFLASLEAGVRARRAAWSALRQGAGRIDRGVRLTAWLALLAPGASRRLLYRSSLRRWRLRTPPRA